ncbi:MAG: hydrolase 1, exosortase A system-associated [Alphaproteobacteria bacterium]|nr:hydrolase 1, exosortase A system-associated [Alphaproteobacteria bacterium]
MTFTETAFTFFNNNDDRLIGIVHNPAGGSEKVGLLIVVGGPQYRIGAHRQYVDLARYCARRGIAAMRFDYQGIGDSDGSYPGFEQVSSDIHSAIEEFIKRVPTLESVALWGLCEGASALLLGGADHQAVSRIILANPWVRSERGLAKAYIKHYYLDRLTSRDFWKKIFSGHLDLKAAVAGLWANITRASRAGSPAAQPSGAGDDRPFPARMLSGFRDFPGKTLLIMSANDLVAREFDDLISGDRGWRDALRQKGLTRIDIAESDHTFSTEKWRMRVAEATAEWLISGQ